ncbi:F-box/kelch-repeat protein At3g23880-like [Mangifera indica]|uniref:F-box/kelch-repeat protein At3g23880-like n=1 Tax=Mangifera indica TaxID=29780 RepID=UPI001CF9918C|nr:F-box/kelch-repeat protein At3g23880-like [Mangifera indica]
MEGFTVYSTERAAPVPFFPDDIIQQILLKLPTKSLLRFKCVCKSWRDLISTHEFAIKHLTETSERFRRFGVFESEKLREGRISLYSLAAQTSSRAEEAEEETICLPLRGKDCYLAPAANEYIINRFIYTRVLGSCNGILLIRLENVEESSGHPRTFLLWNPTIREFKMIPPCYFKSSLCSLVSGLGYNSSIDNYKVVVVFSERNSDLAYGYVYNLKTNSWKRLENFYFPYKNTRQVNNFGNLFLSDETCLGYLPEETGYLLEETGTTIVNGAPHWVTLSSSRGGVNKIIYFDLEEEKFKEFLSPPPSAGTFKTYLSIYEDCLCETRLRREKGFFEYMFEVWIMKEYGVKESWIKLLNLPFDLRFSLMSDIRPLFVSKNGDEVVMVTDWSDMISFNTRTGEVKKVSMRVDRGHVVGSYKESLVSPNQFSMSCSEDGKY